MTMEVTVDADLVALLLACWIVVVLLAMVGVLWCAREWRLSRARIRARQQWIDARMGRR